MRGGIFNNRLLFQNNMPLFSGNFCGGQGLDGGGHSRDRENPQSPTGENPAKFTLIPNFDFRGLILDTEANKIWQSVISFTLAYITLALMPKFLELSYLKIGLE